MKSMASDALTSPVTYKGVPGMARVTHEQLVIAEGVARAMHEIADDVRVHFDTHPHPRLAWSALGFSDRAHAIAVCALVLKREGIS